MKNYDSVTNGLDLVYSKLSGIGELFEMAKSEPTLSDAGLKGIALLLTEIAVDVENITDLLRGRQVDVTRIGNFRQTERT